MPSLLLGATSVFNSVRGQSEEPSLLICGHYFCFFLKVGSVLFEADMCFSLFACRPGETLALANRGNCSMPPPSGNVRNYLRQKRSR
jgi:hypothetical protein